MSVSSPSGGTLGDDIRQVREARRLTQRALGAAAGYSVSYVTKVETGVVFPALRFVEGCDRAFGTGDLFVRQRRRLVEGENPAWFTPHLEAEKVAVAIHDYSIAFITGLLQTPDYARAVLDLGLLPLPREEIEAQVRSRMNRRAIFDRPGPPRVWVVLHEACLWSCVGSAKLMAEQLSYLVELLKRCPTLTVQVLPYQAAGAATNTPFTTLEIPEGAPVMYVEGPQGSRPYTSDAVVANSRRFLDHLRAAAMSPHDSAEYIETVGSEHARDAVDQVQLQRRHRRQLRRVGAGARVRRRSGAGAGQ
ncbi:helix-turn-helix transcriptional regulator [Streptomyces tubbatahanensis]|uniref:helix-turn-helix domain-containing protein n=1 Tax=Streptomyces tubbatahanensis TaxID=2923272 RepID=UPI00311AF4B5